MPDKAGRPIAQDWIALGDAFSRGLRNADQREDRRMALETRNRVQHYLNQMAQGQTPDVNDPTYQYMDHLAAEGIVGRQALADENLKQLRLTNDQKAAQENQKKINDAINAAKVHYFGSQKATSDKARKSLENKAFDALLPVYDHIPDGGTFVRWKDDDRTAMVFKDMHGNEVEQPTPTLQRAMSMAVTASSEYAKLFVDTKEKVRKLNADQIIKAATDPNRRMRTSGGKEAVYVPFLDVSPTGDMVLRQTWSDPKTGKVLKGFDPDTGKEVKSSLDFRPETYWKTVASLPADDRKAWDNSVAAAAKAWNSAVKEGQVDPAETDGDQWQRIYIKSYYLRLRPNGKLPPGFESGAGASGDRWQDYVRGMGSDPVAPHADGLKAAHGPGAAAGAGVEAAAGPGPAAAAPDQGPVVRDVLPKNPAAWKVSEITRDGRVVPVAEITTQTGQVQQLELTPDEYVFWLTQKGQQREGSVGDVVRQVVDWKMRNYAEKHKGAAGPAGERTY